MKRKHSNAEASTPAAVTCSKGQCSKAGSCANEASKFYQKGFLVLPRDGRAWPILSGTNLINVFAVHHLAPLTARGGRETFAFCALSVDTCMAKTHHSSTSWGAERDEPPLCPIRISMCVGRALLEKIALQG